MASRRCHLSIEAFFQLDWCGRHRDFASGPQVAWDYEGHRIVNHIALSSLPTNFLAFVRTPAALERIAILAGEPDRWRNITDLPLKHFNGPDHYIDLEELRMSAWR